MLISILDVSPDLIAVIGPVKSLFSFSNSDMIKLFSLSLDCLKLSKKDKLDTELRKEYFTFVFSLADSS